MNKTVKAAAFHINDRIANGKPESEASTIMSSETSKNTKVTKSSHSSELELVARSVGRSVAEIRQQEAKDAKESLDKLEKEKRVHEEDLQRKLRHLNLINK